MVYIARSLLDIGRRTHFANVLCSSDIDIVCISETWLTDHVPHSALFLPQNELTSKNRKCYDSSGNTRYGGVLIGVKKSLELDLDFDDVCACFVKNLQVLIVTVYSANNGSQYRWSIAQFTSLFSRIQSFCDEKRQGVRAIFAGDINMLRTDWNSFLSPNEYESELLDLLLANNFSQLLRYLNNESGSLNVLFTNDQEMVINCSANEELEAQLRYNERCFSNHMPYLAVRQSREEVQVFKKFCPPTVSFASGNFDELNDNILLYPFDLICYSNCDVLVSSWYDWVTQRIEELFPKKTSHRKLLPPWVSSETSNLIKRLHTARKQKPKHVVTQLELTLKEALDNAQIDYEGKLFENRCFSRIYKYFKTVKAPSRIPCRLYLDKEDAVTDVEKSNLFNRFFASVYNVSSCFEIDLDEEAVLTPTRCYDFDVRFCGQVVWYNAETQSLKKWRTRLFTSSLVQRVPFPSQVPTSAIPDSQI